MFIKKTKWDLFRSHVLYLFYGEYFTDALRNTLTVIIPMLLLFFFRDAQTAIGVGLGALLISLTDAPGNKADKFKSAVTSVIIFFLTALVVSFSLGNTLLTALSIFLTTFLLTMIAVFGQRAGLTGTMAIILGIFILGLQPREPIMFSLYILAGGIWYYLISLMQILIWPYRSLHQAIFECIRSTSAFLKEILRQIMTIGVIHITLMAYLILLKRKNPRSKNADSTNIQNTCLTAASKISPTITPAKVPAKRSVFRFQVSPNLGLATITMVSSIQ